MRRHPVIAVALVAASGLLVTSALAGPAPRRATPAAKVKTASRRGMPGGLLDAYRKEFAFLEAQKRELQKRLASLTGLQAAKLSKARSAVTGLQATVVALRSKADALAQTLSEARRKSPEDDSAERVVETIDRARQTLQKAGVKLVPETPTDPAKQLPVLERIFADASLLLRRGGQIRREKGAFFLADGRRVSGILIRVGQIATFGLSSKGSGALAPAGQGRLKLWPKSSADTAKALAAGRSPSSIQIFFYESLDKDVQVKQERSWLETIRAGGLVAWVIVGLGGLALLLVFTRIIILIWSSLGVRSLPRKLEPLLTAGRLDAAQELVKGRTGSTAKVLWATLANVGRSREQMEDAVSEALLREAPKIELFGAVITVFAAVAPLLGLLGTVTGMISTFDVITEHGTGDPKLLSGGISEALITTKLGLLVAIPALLVGTLLRGQAESLQAAIERAALHVINLVSEDPIADEDSETGDVVRPQPELAQEPT